MILREVAILQSVIDQLKPDDVVKMLQKTIKKKITGYLLCQNEQERLLDVYRCTVFGGADGTILITDTLTCMPGAIKYHLKLNKHVNLISYSPGWAGDDFMKCKCSTILQFRFNYSMAFDQLIGY